MDSVTFLESGFLKRQLQQEGDFVKDDIKKIIYDNGLGLVDKIIKIDKLISGENWDVEALSSVLHIPVAAIMSEPEPVLFVGAPEKKSSNKQYVGIFLEGYAKITGKKYIFSGQDFGQIKNIVKIIDHEKFRKIMAYLVFRKQQEKTVKMDWNIDRIIKGLTPGMIYKNINLLLTESENIKSKSWGYGR